MNNKQLTVRPGTTASARLLRVAVSLAMVLLAGSAFAATPIKVGSAARDITPAQDMLPITRAPNIELASVADPIHVRVIALSSGKATTLLVSSETGRSLGPQLARELSRHVGIPLEAILFTGTHAYAAPEITDNWMNLLDVKERGAVPASEAPVVKLTNQQRWAMYAQQQLLAAADEAIAGMKPAAVGIGYTSDKTVVAIRFNGKGGKALAFVVNEVAHGAATQTSTAISAGVPGMISAQLEQKNPGSVAIWLSGTPDGSASLTKREESFLPDVEKALSTIRRYESNAQVNYDYRDANSAKTGGNDISLQVLRIGDIALIGVPGELSSTLSKSIKQSSSLKNTLPVNYAWQRPYQHADVQAGDANANQLGQALAGLTAAMIKETNDWTFNGDGTATSKSGKRVIVGLDGAAGTADDNQIVNPAGTVLQKNVKVLADATSVAYVPLGNGFNLYAGQDNNLGTTDDMVKGFGHFPQSDPTGAKSDPLSWRLADIQDGKATLIASAQLDSIQFNLQAGDGNDYTQSNLRSWLNSRGGRNLSGDTVGFYNAAFSETEKAKILPTSLNKQTGPAFGAVTPPFADKTQKYSTPAMDVQDPVWTISGEEAIQYFGPNKLRIAQPNNNGGDGSYFTNGNIVPTAYARAKGVKINVGGNGPATVGYGDSWLRTAGRNDGKDYYAIFMSSLGNLNGRRTVSSTYGALPAMTVSLNER